MLIDVLKDFRRSLSVVSVDAADTSQHLKQKKSHRMWVINSLAAINVHTRPLCFSTGDQGHVTHWSKWCPAACSVSVDPVKPSIGVVSDLLCVSNLPVHPDNRRNVNRGMSFTLKRRSGNMQSSAYLAAQMLFSQTIVQKNSVDFMITDPPWSLHLTHDWERFFFISLMKQWLSELLHQTSFQWLLSCKVAQVYFWMCSARWVRWKLGLEKSAHR